MSTNIEDCQKEIREILIDGLRCEINASKKNLEKIASSWFLSGRTRDRIEWLQDGERNKLALLSRLECEI